MDTSSATGGTGYVWLTVTPPPGHRHWYATRDDTTVQPGGGTGVDGVGTDWVGVGWAGVAVGGGLDVVLGAGLAIVVVGAADGDPTGGAFVPQPTEAGRINVSRSRALVRVLRVGLIAASFKRGMGLSHSYLHRHADPVGRSGRNDPWNRAGGPVTDMVGSTSIAPHRKAGPGFGAPAPFRTRDA